MNTQLTQRTDEVLETADVNEEYSLDGRIPHDATIVEIGPTDARLAEYLTEMVSDRYLGLCGDPRLLRRLRDSSPHLRDRFQPLESLDQVASNNADVLVFTDNAVSYLIDRRHFTHAKWVMVRPSSLSSRLASYPIWRHRTHSNQIIPTGPQEFEDKDGKRHTLLAGVVPAEKRRAPTEARHYISPAIGVTGLLRWLDDNGVRYVVPRWFDSLPELAVGEDLDLLVADEDVDRVASFLAREPGTVPVDMYSCSGLPGSSYRSMAYYPPELAEQILQGRVLYKDSFYVPDPRHHLLSFAYHAAYHKGSESGLSAVGSEDTSTAAGARDYRAELCRLSGSLGVELEPSLDVLDEYLASEGWRPPKDTLKRLASRNDWVASRLGNVEIDLSDGELIVYILRDYAVDNGLEDRVAEVIRSVGLEIVLRKELSSEERDVARRHVRGGNWSKGGSEVDPGGPGYLIVAFDYSPAPARQIDRRYPLVRNLHFFYKQWVRYYFDPERPTDQQTNFIHSSDNEAEAWDYLEVLVPHVVDELRERIERSRSSFRTKENVIRHLANSSAHSKVEIIEFQGEPAVKKTYAPSQERFLEREKLVHGELSQRLPMIPPLLHSGDDYVILPYYEDTFRYSERKRDGDRRIPRPIAEAGLDVLRRFYDEGYALIDFHPGNVLVDPSGQIRVVDFQYLYRYKTAPASFEDSYDIAGLPDGFDGDVVPFAPRGITYANTWAPYVKHGPAHGYIDRIRAVIRFRTSLRLLAHRGKIGARRLLRPIYSRLMRMTIYELAD